jgi:hypothetical protein
VNRIFLTILTGAMLLSTARADETIHDRKVNQQQRIAKGVQNGSMTARETAHVEHQEAGLNREIRHDRKVNGGNLTNNEKAQVNRQQNHLSREIYRDKHNGKTQ